MITSIPQMAEENLTVARCEYLLAKHCPRLMRLGGGIISKPKDAPRHPPVSKEEHDRMCRLITEGYSINDVATMTKRSVVAVSVHTRGVRDSKPTLATQKAQEAAKTVGDMIRKGMPKIEICAALKLHPTTVTKYAKLAGVYKDERGHGLSKRNR